MLVVHRARGWLSPRVPGDEGAEWMCSTRIHPAANGEGDPEAHRGQLARTPDMKLFRKGEEGRRHGSTASRLTRFVVSKNGSRVPPHFRGRVQSAGRVQGRAVATAASSSTREGAPALPFHKAARLLGTSKGASATAGRLPEDTGPHRRVPRPTTRYDRSEQAKRIRVGAASFDAAKGRAQPERRHPCGAASTEQARVSFATRPLESEDQPFTVMV